MKLGELLYKAQADTPDQAAWLIKSIMYHKKVAVCSATFFVDVNKISYIVIVEWKIENEN
jgi:hypothetical protein